MNPPIQEFILEPEERDPELWSDDELANHYANLIVDEIQDEDDELYIGVE